jgi:F-type H+-transporting ATPase subunit a
MKGTDLFEIKEWRPFSYLNLHHPFLSVNASTLIFTWIVLIVLVIGLWPVRRIVRNKPTITRYIILHYVRSFIQLINQSFDQFSYKHCAFIIALFTFIAACNCIAIVPYIGEPTRDINTCLALGILSFVYVQYYTIRAHGIIKYIKEYFSPFFVMFPLHVLGKLSTIISISFRLFGNMFGSATITHVFLLFTKGSLLYEILVLVTGLNVIIAFFFILFEGFLQAFVFTMLTTTFLAIATTKQEIPGEPL